MQGPGLSLRQAREAHGRTIEEMSEATGIRLPFLTALEEEAFDSLPGRGFGKLYIRAYAEVLGFDPRPVLEAYDLAVRTIDVETPATESATASRPVNAVLARWRQELIARRAEADLSGNPEDLTFDQPEALEDETSPEPEPERFEQVTQTAPVSAHPAGEWIESPHEAVLQEAEAPVPTVHVENDSLLRHAPSRRWLVASLLLLVPLPLLAYFVLSRPTPVRPAVAARVEPVPGKAVAPPPSLPRPPQVVEAPRTPPPSPSPARGQAAPSSLEVVESGLGLRLVGTRLEGEGDRFRTGQRVTFATRIQGGGAGESIRHVWLRDGKVEQSIRLRVGGASWRTWSTKTLGRPGAWAVEARDEQGRVLARADLTVAP